MIFASFASNFPRGIAASAMIQNTFLPLWLGLAWLIVGPVWLRGGDPAPDDTDLHLYLQGRFVFEKNCVICHGRSGRGDGPWAEELIDKPRNFRVGIFKFRSTPCGFLPTDDDLRNTIRSGISGTAMPKFDTLLENDLTAVLTYIKSLSRRWKDKALHAKPVELPEVPDGLLRGTDLAARAAAGRSLFLLTCATCHGETGRGDGPAAKGLVDVWEHPIVPANLGLPHHKSGDSLDRLFRTIALGLDGTPMVGFRGTLQDDQIWNLVAYIKSLERPQE